MVGTYHVLLLKPNESIGGAVMFDIASFAEPDIAMEFANSFSMSQRCSEGDLVVVNALDGLRWFMKPVPVTKPPRSSYGR